MTTKRPRGQSRNARRTFLVNSIGAAYWSGYRAALRKVQNGEHADDRTAEVDRAQREALAEADRRGML